MLSLRPLLPASVLLGCTLLAACATVPPGPNVAVMPTPGEPFAVFRQQDARCRAFASRTTGADPARVAAGGAVAGGVIGAAAGAFLGSLGPGDGDDAGPAAAAGLLVGSSIGAGNGQAAAATLQRRYDIAYEQCMYAHGDRVPGTRSARPAPSRYYPPPPPPPPDQ